MSGVEDEIEEIKKQLPPSAVKKVCNSCNKSEQEKSKEIGKQVRFVNFNLEDPSVDKFWCPTCIDNEKKRVLKDTNVSFETKKPKQPAIKPKITILKPVTDNSAKKDVGDITVQVGKGSEPTVDQVKKIEGIFTDIKNKESQQQKKAFDSLKQNFSDRDAQILKAGMFEYPTTVQFLFTASKYIKSQIIPSNRVIEKLGIDYLNNVEVMRNKYILASIKWVPFKFFIKNTDEFSWIVNAALYQLEQLKRQLMKADNYDEDAEYAYDSIRGVFMEFQFRNNEFEGRLTMVKHKTIELQKLFATLQINLVYLASVESDITKPSDQKQFEQLWQGLPAPSRDAHIANNVNLSIIDAMKPEDRIRFFDYVLPKIYVKPDVIFQSFERLKTLEEREKVLKHMKTQGFSKSEYAILFPEQFKDSTTK